ncbi:hypothetical protein [Streptomyces sp. NBRC 110611]|uniref:hypothetical protein n=1 Tax=Streptomyces sp. NBRC 110611 TaxID=1621259 RepID=UPI000AC6E05B|nr:hypothetical protein [Streptomyces sp. NBRC 110611]
MTNRLYLGEVCGTTVLSKTSGQGKTTLVLTVEKGVSASWDKSLSIDAKYVNAGMGFNVTKSYTVKNETRFEVPAGKRGYVEAYPLYNRYSARVSDALGIFMGNITALKPVGVCFNQWAK